MRKQSKLEFYRTVIAVSVPMYKYRFPKSVLKYKSKDYYGQWNWYWERDLPKKSVDDLVSKIAATLTQTTYGVVFVTREGNETSYKIPYKVVFKDNLVRIYTTRYQFIKSQTGKTILTTRKVYFSPTPHFEWDFITMRDFKQVLYYYASDCGCKKAKTLRDKLNGNG